MSRIVTLRKHGDTMRALELAENIDTYLEQNERNIKECFGIATKDDRKWNIVVSYAATMCLMLKHVRFDDIRYEDGSYMETGDVIY